MDLVDQFGRPFAGINGVKPSKPNVARYDDFALPHVLTSASVFRGGWWTYLHDKWDEALKHSRQNALSMWHDAWLQSLLDERIEGTLSLKWHLEVDDPKDKWQRMVKEVVTKAIKRTPFLPRFIRQLLTCLWYGRAANQVIWDWTEIDSKKVLHVKKHIPVQGDKIGYRFDQMPYVLVHGASEEEQLGKSEIIVTSLHKAILLKGSWRDRFVIARHNPEDADFFEAEMAGRIGGVGIRDRIYWLWWLRQEYLAWIIDHMERVGLGIVIVYYEVGNDASEAAANEVAGSYGRRTIIKIPRPAGTLNSRSAQGPYGIEIVETPTAGIEVLKSLQESIEEKIERYMIGQSMSGGSDEGNGLGGSGRANFAADTKFKKIAGDAIQLAEHLTGSLHEPGLVSMIFRWSFPDLWNEFPVRFVFDVDEWQPEKKLEAVSKAVSIGVRFKEDEVRSLTGLGAPEKDDKVIGGQEQGGAPPPGGMPGMPPGGMPQPGAPGMSPEPQGGDGASEGGEGNEAASFMEYLESLGESAAYWREGEWIEYAFNAMDWEPHTITRGPRKDQRVFRHIKTGKLIDKMPEKQQGPTHAENASRIIDELKANHDPDKATSLHSALAGMKVADLAALKKKHGIRASGTKAEVAKKIAAAVLSPKSDSHPAAVLKAAQEAASNPTPENALKVLDGLKGMKLADMKAVLKHLGGKGGKTKADVQGRVEEKLKGQVATPPTDSSKPQSVSNKIRQPHEMTRADFVAQASAAGKSTQVAAEGLVSNAPNSGHALLIHGRENIDGIKNDAMVIKQGPRRDGTPRPDLHLALVETTAPDGNKRILLVYQGKDAKQLKDQDGQDGTMYVVGGLSYRGNHWHTTWVSPDWRNMGLFKHLIKHAEKKGLKLDPETPTSPEYLAANAKKKHRDTVEQALASGKSVPPEVLKDYPDLAAKPQPEAAPQAPQAPQAPKAASAAGKPTTSHASAAHSAIASVVGEHNLASLADVRDALAKNGITERGAQDAAINELRKSGVVSASAMENRHPPTERELAAAMDGGEHQLGHLSLREVAKPATKSAPKAATPKQPTTDSHPLVGQSREQMVQTLTKEASGQNANPRNYDTKNYPSGVDGKKLETDVASAIAEHKKGNSFSRPNIRSLYEKVKANHPSLTVHGFQSSLAKMQLDGKIQMGAYTQALGAADEKDLPFLMPVDREAKFYVDTKAQPKAATPTATPQTPTPVKPQSATPAASTPSVETSLSTLASSASGIDPYLSRTLSQQPTLHGKLKALASLDVKVFDQFVDTPEGRAAGITNNEYLRGLSTFYGQYQERKAESPEYAKSELGKRIDVLVTQTRAAVAGLRKLGKVKEADFYEQHAIPLMEAVKGAGAEAKTQTSTPKPTATPTPATPDAVHNHVESLIGSAPPDEAGKPLLSLPDGDAIAVARRLMGTMHTKYLPKTARTAQDAASAVAKWVQGLRDTFAV